MKNLLKYRIINLFFTGIFMLGFCGVAMNGTASAGLFDGSKDEVCNAVGAGTGGTNSKCDPVELEKGSEGLSTTLAKILNIISIIVGVIAVIMIIISGFRFITSGGDSNQVTSAKNTFIYAIVGLILVAFAQIIVKFVLSKI